MRAASAPSSVPWLPFAAAGGLAVLILLFAVAASTGRRPSPPVEPPATKAEAPTAGVRPPVPPDPPPRPAVDRPEPAPPPVRPDPARELAELDGQIRPYLDKGQFVNALLTLEAARGRHPDSAWTAEIDRRLADIKAARDRAAPPPSKPPPPPPPSPAAPPVRPPPPPPVARSAVPPSTPGLLAWWRLNERAGTTASDLAGACPGQLTGATEWNADPPALKLSGKGSGVVIGRNTDLMRKASSGTVTAWIHPQGSSSGAVKPGRILTIDRGKPPARPRFALELVEKNQLRFAGRAADEEESESRVVGTSSPVAPDRWQHVAATVDYGRRVVRLYLDGRPLETDAELRFSAPETSDTPAAQVAVGAWGSLEGGFFRGLLADVRLFSRVLDPAEIAALAGTPPSAVASGADRPGPVGWWRLDDRAGQKAADAANAFPGTLDGQAAWNDWPSALRLDGQKGAVVVGENLDLLRGTKAATLTAWIRPESGTALLAPGRIATFTGAVEEGRRPASRFSFEIADGNRLRFVGRAADGEEETRVTASAVRVVRDRWQHAAVVVDYAGRAVRIYLDGREQAGSGMVGFTAPQTSDTPVGRALLGAAETPDARVFRGMLSDVRIYTRGLDAAEVAALAVNAPAEPGAARPERVKDGLVALYTFTEGSGERVKDVSGFGEPLDLTIADSKNVRWLQGRGLEITRSTALASAAPAVKIEAACKQSNEITVEAWVRAARAEAKGPARIVTMSANTKLRNFCLGQGKNMNDGDVAVWSIRCRTSKTDGNGLPGRSTPDGSVTAGQLAHLTYTRAADGREHLYVDGVPVISETLGGDLRNWDAQYPLTLANDTTRDRAWLGEYRLVAIYARALSAAEVVRNFDARAD